MKKSTLLLSLFLLTVCCNLSFAQIYVNYAATGANTGASWDDAFSDLQDAISTAAAGDEIWVAAGTYKPAGPGGTAAATFHIDKDLRLLGGFAGDETTAAERDPEANETILSGDLNGDDVEDEYSMHRHDNVMTVLTVQAGVTGETLIDGFTIGNGQADGVGSGPNTNGGAVYITGAPVIRQCIFLQNYALNSGGAVRTSGGLARGTVIEDCHFEKNRADANGGGVSISGLASVDPGIATQVKNTTFLSNLNSDGRGGGLSVINTNVKVSDCSFMDNSNEEQGGGMWIYITGGLNYELEVEGCYFENNRASFGGGFYFLNFGHSVTLSVRNTQFSENSVFPMPNGWGQGGGGVCMYIDESTSNAYVEFDNCSFDGNTTTSTGGGFRVTNNGTGSNFLIKNCDFTRNESVYHGGGFRIWVGEEADQSSITVDSCLFSQNTVDMWTGSGFRAILLGPNTNLSLSNSLFTQNTTGLAGAAGIYGFTDNSSGQVIVNQCTFQENTSGYDAGLSLGSGTEASLWQYTISHCDFKNNASEFWGGGAALYAEVPANFIMDDCLFEGNQAGEIGGGMYVANTNPETEMVIQNSIWRNNGSPFGAAIGAIPFTEMPEDFSITREASIRFENCLVYENNGDSAAIALKQTGNVTLMNCTVVDNEAGGLALDTASSFTLQNTILANPGYTEYEVFNEDVAVTSNNGNLVLDNSLNEILTNKDKSETEPGFEPDTYEPASDSPLINGGSNDGVTSEYDLAGNPRIQHDIVDIGAYESPFDLVSAREEIAGTLNLLPNPAREYLNLNLPESLHPHRWSLLDRKGQLVGQGTVTTGDMLPIGHLPTGIYTLKVAIDNQVYIGRFAKH